MGQGDLETKAGMKHQSRVQYGDPPGTRASVSYPMGVELSKGKWLNNLGMLYESQKNGTQILVVSSSRGAQQNSHKQHFQATTL